MTKKEMYGFIATLLADNEEVVDFCQHQIDLLDARKASTGLSKTQKENLGILEDIKMSLRNIDVPVTVTDLINLSPALHGLTNQKVSALLRKLMAEGAVEKTIEGKKALFSLV